MFKIEGVGKLRYEKLIILTVRDKLEVKRLDVTINGGPSFVSSEIPNGRNKEERGLNVDHKGQQTTAFY